MNINKSLTYPVSPTDERKHHLSQFLKDPASSITHLIGMLATLLFTPALLAKASLHDAGIYVLSAGLFAGSMVLLYMASASYHGFYASEKTTLRLKKWDHMMIYVLIAGSYSPICLLVLPRHTGLILFAVVWGLAGAGQILTAVWVDSPKWMNSIIYICMGWLVVFQMKEIIHLLTPAAFGWLLAGGIIYTIGGILYALKLSVFNHLHQGFGSHEIFHLFVMAGSICHFVLVYKYLI